MQTLQSGYRGLSLIVMLNADRALYIAAIAAALGASAWLSGL